MGLTNNRLQYYADKYNRYLIILEKMYAALESCLDNGDVQSYSFDTGDGKQSTTYTSFDELQRAINRTERMVDHLYQKLNNMGLMNMNLRRKPYRGIR